MNPVWFILSIILLPLTTVQAVIYKKPGDTVLLSPGSVTPPITSITWKHNSNLAAEWNGGGAIDFYREFKGRCILKTESGELTITNLTLKDSGSYTPEINNRVLGTTEIKFMSGVPTPTIAMSCDDEKTHCVLTCEGDTTDSEPVTYTWWSGDVVKSETKEFKITKEETTSFFRCKMENLVNSQFSKQVVNPVLISNTDNPDMYRKVGDSLVLSVSSKDATITSIVWKHGSNGVVEWNRGEPVYNKDFIGRCRLNSRTGELIISGLKPKDSGSYTVEINGDAIKTTKIKVISGVPTPTISMSCDDEKTHCVLTCEGDTTGVEQVTYTWKSGDVVKSETKEFKITKDDTEPSFTCELENPVSSERSREVLNPFISSPSSPPPPSSTSITGNRTLFIPILVLVLLILLVVVIVLYRLKHRKVEPQVPIGTEYDTVQAINNDYGKLPSDYNGRTVYATVEFANRDQGPDCAPMPPPNSNGTVYATVQRVTDQPALLVP
ncbi:T-lymphocyte surface antigen Ly-9-like [Mugil cephalus]|uniref:T-lymphocyte surface antigen Ly-9-like n=1 Tax=Mugil cephalus TaxID=48193 RepID=UPI001FB5F1D7|nr:T-lymphocyte surface antigen Ly-9-like [Mugil cephalus]